MSVEAARRIGLDLGDVERRVGQWIGGGELREPMSALDIRRWVQAMDYANPLHWDEDFASASRFKGIVAPQSFVLATDSGHEGAGAQKRQAPAGTHTRYALGVIAPRALIPNAGLVVLAPAEPSASRGT